MWTSFKPFLGFVTSGWANTTPQIPAMSPWFPHPNEGCQVCGSD
jgi:hypothetical protein